MARLQPSFRGRLRLFFVVIVIVPMIAVGFVLFRLVDKSDQGRLDARLSEAANGANGLLVQDRQQAAMAANALTQDPAFSAALQAGRPGAIKARLDTLSERSSIRRARVVVPGARPVESGAPPAVAPATLRLKAAGGGNVGRLTTSTTAADAFARRVKSFLTVDAVVSEGGNVVSTTLPGAATVDLPARGSVKIGDREYRTTTVSAPAFDGGRTTVQLLLHDPSPSPLSSSTLLVIGVTLGFLALALVFALTVSRTLSAEIQRLLEAARRLGAGDFSVSVPAEGHDEFAALGAEFNNMARQLKGRLEDLQRERTRLEEAIRRVGESFARGLDRSGLLEIVVQTAVDGVGGQSGRAMMRVDGHLEEVAAAGGAHGLRRALHAAEVAVEDAGQLAEIHVGGAAALAAPLGAAEGDRVIGLVSVAREGPSFSAGERELFAYLTNQAAVSVENVDLHETVQRQAMTDELTGLFNHRRFQEVMTSEVERARRYDQDMGLIMLDLDNFKRVNDTYGHMQGDMVLREVARVLRQSAREIDEPARYGGEEMAIALPQTDLDGAYNFAERVRHRIEALELPLLEGDGTLRVTASFGAASLAHSPSPDKDSLVAAADAALYRAKRSGKNRTVRAE
jgi:diguanylate cyclase (GGDEF)-like protein